MGELFKYMKSCHGKENWTVLRGDSRDQWEKMEEDFLSPNIVVIRLPSLDLKCLPKTCVLESHSSGRGFWPGHETIRGRVK